MKTMRPTIESARDRCSNCSEDSARPPFQQRGSLITSPAGVGMADEPHSSHAHDIWRAQGVCLVPTTHHPPYMDGSCGRLYTAFKSIEVLHMRTGQREGRPRPRNGHGLLASPRDVRVPGPQKQ